MSQKVFLKYKIPALSTELQGVITSLFSPGKLSGFELQPNDPANMGVKIVAPEGITSRFLHTRGVIVTETPNSSITNFTLNPVVNAYSRRTDVVVIEYIHSASYGQAEYKLVEGPEVSSSGDAIFPALSTYQIPLGYIHLTSDTTTITTAEIQNIPSRETLPDTSLDKALTITNRPYWVSGGGLAFDYADEENKEIEGEVVAVPTSILVTVSGSEFYMGSQITSSNETTIKLPTLTSYGTYYIVADFHKPDEVRAIEPKIKLVTSGQETQSRYIPLYKLTWSEAYSYFSYMETPESYIGLTDIRFERIVLSDVLPTAAKNVSHNALKNKGADDHPQYTLADGSRPFTGPVAGKAPTASNHLVTRSFTENLMVKALAILPCRVTTTTNISFEFAPNSVQSVQLKVGDRILVQGQTDKKQNGIYSVQTLGTGNNGVWVRAWDALGGTEVDFTGRVYVVLEGESAYKGVSFITSVGKIVVGSTAIEFKPHLQSMLKIDSGTLFYDVDTLSVKLRAGHINKGLSGLELPSIVTPTAAGESYNTVSVDAQGRVTLGEFVSYLLNKGNCSGIMIDTFDARPAASSVGAGTIFIATEDVLEDTIFISNGTTWTARGGSGAINKTLFQVMFGTFIEEEFIVTMNPHVSGGFNSTIPAFTYYHNGSAIDKDSVDIHHPDIGERTDVVYINLTTDTVAIETNVADGYEPENSLVLYWAYIPVEATVETIAVIYADYAPLPYSELRRYLENSVEHIFTSSTTVTELAGDIVPRVNELESKVTLLDSMEYTANSLRNLLSNSSFENRNSGFGVLENTNGPLSLGVSSNTCLWNSWNFTNNTDTNVSLSLYDSAYDGKGLVKFLKVTVPYVGSGTRTVRLYQKVSEMVTHWGLESLTGSITAYANRVNTTEFRVYHTFNFGVGGAEPIVIPGDSSASVAVREIATRYSQTSTIPNLEGTIKGEGAYYEVAFQFEFKHTSGSVDLYIAIPKLEFGTQATPYKFWDSVNNYMSREEALALILALS